MQLFIIFYNQMLYILFQMILNLQYLIIHIYNLYDHLEQVYSYNLYQYILYPIYSCNSNQNNIHIYIKVFLISHFMLIYHYNFREQNCLIMDIIIFHIIFYVYIVLHFNFHLLFKFHSNLIVIIIILF